MPGVEEWAATWKRFRIEKVDGDLYWKLIGRYQEPQRRYHTVHHLDECFARLRESRSAVEHPAEVELALWFHDAVYDVRRQDNEERSAAWAEAEALRAGVSATVATRIHDLILATRHTSTPETVDAKLLVDVDLAILGAPPDRFDEYERQVREEYASVPDAQFRRERAEILLSFLRRDHIFSTEYFRATYEAQARANLERSIRALLER